MKKIFSFLAAMMLLVSSASATTIYCKMDKAWWTADGAAVGIYTWDTLGVKAAEWPGVRMTPVDGQAGVWSYDLNLDAYKQCIFTRVNANGDIADWGAKTKDLTIPTDGKNLFTITNEEATWGDPGCDGVWSVYGAAEMTAVYNWSKEAAEQVGTTVLGASGVEISTVKIHTNTDAVNAIKFGSSYVYADGKWIAIKPAQGGFKAGDVLNVAVVFNNADDTKYCMADVYAADGATRLWRSDSASTINGRTSAAEPIVQAYTLESDQDSLLIGRYGNTGMFITLLTVARAEGGDTPEPVNPIVETYFATGDGWSADTESSAVWDAEAQKVTVNIALDKVAQWQAQVKYQGIASEPGKFYHVGLKMKANSAISGVTIKWEDNTGILQENASVALEANTEFVYNVPSVASNAAGNGILVLDFGYAKAGNVIEIYDLVIEEIPAPTVNLEDGYYILGLNGWTIYDLTAADKFAANGETAGEYVITKTLAANQEFKVVAVANNELGVWYPAEAGNYVVDLAHAGEKAIYFRPDYQGGEGWYAGCIYIAANEAPVNPIDHVYFATGSGWDADNESKAEWDPETGKITVTLALEKVAAWQGQVFVNAVHAEVGKCYNFGVKMKANKNMTGVTIKWQENNNDPIMVSEINTLSLTANEEFVYFKGQIPGQEGNGMLVYDFGFAEAGTIVEIYDLVIEDTTCAAPVEAAYYLAGSMNGWNDAVNNPTYKFTVNPENEAEYIYTMTLAAGDEFKVVKVENGTETWMPDGMGNNYVVDAAHAGEKTIYFRPDGQGGEGWHYGYIYVPANTEAIDNTAAEVKAVKTVINGQLVIIKGDKIYNAVGTQIR